MLQDEFLFVDRLKQTGDETWHTIALKFSNVFNTEVSADTLKKRYSREMSRRYLVSGDDVDKAIQIIKRNPIKPTELARQLGLDINGLESLLDDIVNTRAAIKFQNNMLVFDKLYAPEDKVTELVDILHPGEEVKFGVYSDTHFCSINEQTHLLEAFYRIGDNEGVVAYLDSGDVTAGNGGVYKGQYQELKIIGIDKQVEYVANTHPYSDKPTYKIAGNHDLDAYKNAGVDVLERICTLRDDLHYLGQIAAYIKFPETNTTFYLMHGEGGVPYARTYKMQKHIDEMSYLPNVAIFGHWHIMSHLPNYKNVIGIMPGCFEAQTGYLKRKGLEPEVGAAILTIKAVEGEEGYVLRHSIDFFNMGMLSNYGKKKR